MTRPAFSRRGLHADSLPGHLNDGAGGRSPQDRRNRLPPRKGTGCRWTHVLLGGLVLVVLAFFGLGIWQLTLMTSAGGPGEFVSRIGGGGRRARPVGSVLRFVPSDLMRRFEEQRSALDRRRSDGRLGLRPPRLALVSVFESSCGQIMVRMKCSRTCGPHTLELKSTFSLLSGKAPYRPVHTGPTADQYADRLLPGGTKKRKRRKKKKYLAVVLACETSPPSQPAGDYRPRAGSISPLYGRHQGGDSALFGGPRSWGL
ncbi:hypothetical protein BHM03_00055219 [Ensete ventricosum]|nr:hypothetical protein BHM03_00055219 [Ensete ventricosum]